MRMSQNKGSSQSEYSIVVTRTEDRVDILGNSHYSFPADLVTGVLTRDLDHKENRNSKNNGP